MLFISTQNVPIQFFTGSICLEKVENQSQLNTHRIRTGFVQLDFMQNPVPQQIIKDLPNS